MDKAKDKVEEFNNNSNKGFSETTSSLKNLFSLISSSGTTLGTLFPELRGPFKNLVKDIAAVKKAYSEISNVKIKENVTKEENIVKKDNVKKAGKEIKEKIPTKDINKQAKPKVDTKNLNLFKDVKNLDTTGKISKDLLSLKGITKSLSVEGGAAVKAFAATTVGALALAVVAVVGVAVAIKKVINHLSNLAKQDIEYEKLARQLWTTKENARDVDSALKTLGASMEDIKLSPTLLKQFSQLRKDAAQLRMPAEFKDNIKVVQGIGLEFKRFKQSIKLFFQLVGNYILKYCAGPLASIKKNMKKFNDKALKVIPVLAKLIGSALGIILRLILTVGEVLAIPFKIISKGIGFIIGLFNKIPEPLKKILKIIGIIAAFIITGPVGAIMLAIAAIDDLFTFFRGGKSIIGDVFNFFKKAGKGAIESIKGKFGTLKKHFKNGMSSLKDDWNGYLDKASKVLDAIKEKAKSVWGHIKDWSKGLWEKTKDFVVNIPSKVNMYNKEYGTSRAPASYLTNKVSNSQTTANSNNKISTENTIHVYGTEPKSTARELDKRLSGVTQRSLQGVF